MIELSRLNGTKYVVNCELIKFVEATPDTVITLTTGEKLMVKESVENVIEQTVKYRQRIYRDPPASPDRKPPGAPEGATAKRPGEGEK